MASHFQAGDDGHGSSGEAEILMRTSVSRALFEAVQRVEQAARSRRGAGSGRLLRRRHRRDFPPGCGDSRRQRGVSITKSDGVRLRSYPATVRRHRSPAVRRYAWTGEVSAADASRHRHRARGGCRSPLWKQPAQKSWSTLSAKRPRGIGRNQGAGAMESSLAE